MVQECKDFQIKTIEFEIESVRRIENINLYSLQLLLFVSISVITNQYKQAQAQTQTQFIMKHQ